MTQAAVYVLSECDADLLLKVGSSSFPEEHVSPQRKATIVLHLHNIYVRLRLLVMHWNRCESTRWVTSNYICK